MIAQRIKISAWIILCLVALAGINAHNIYAMYWSAPGATVWLKGCNGDACAIHGTLKAVPWSNGAYELTGKDGGTTPLPKGSYSKMQYLGKQS